MNSGLIDDRSHLGLPFVGNQVDQLILGSILDATEHVTQVFVGVDIVCLAVGKYRQGSGQTLPAFGTADIETVVPILRQSADFSLDAIVREIEGTVFQTMQQTGIFLLGILHSLDQFGFFLRVKFFFKYVELIFDTLQYRTYLQDSLRRKRRYASSLVIIISFFYFLLFCDSYF